ncbi:MAG TPA: nickel-dependent lactate racemase [Verrucomicrobiae bacterium]|jgi:nickel-dependent lactate racemase|nr:nickel-dependent lactate racemase [Verrucomicrobiae bacterium]
MKINLAYGRGHLPIELPDKRTTVIEPAHTPGLADERAAMMAALEKPIGAAPLREWIKPGDKVCIGFTDITRATPNHRLIPWLLEYLAHVPREQITLLNSLGTHRPNTRAELEQLLTPEVVRNYRVLNHEPENPAELVPFGTTRDGTPALINRHVAEADVRIVTGFIEPHFFAGFSGGPKGIMPGLAGLETVMSNHGEKMIGDPRATFGVTDGNPIWEEMRDIALRVGKSFLLNVSLNETRAITGVFAGDLLAAHKVGFEFVRHAAMQRVKSPFEIVVTTNSGYPLDQNLYQGVKGMSAGARIIQEGGTLILACECREGVPAQSPLDKLLRSAGSPEEILALLATPGFVRPEQWQAQIQALIQRKARVLIHSSLPDEIVRTAHLTPCHDIGATVNERLAQLGPEARVAVLPQGPLTIPYLA